MPALNVPSTSDPPILRETKIIRKSDLTRLTHYWDVL